MTTKNQRIVESLRRTTDNATPRPWQVFCNNTVLFPDSGLECPDSAIIAAGDQEICVVHAFADPAETDAHAALIVRAVNAHAELVAALAEMVRLTERRGDWPKNSPMLMALGAARAALAKAES